mgnify:CR=1 FL=1
MKVITDSKEDKNKIINSIINLLNKNKLLTLSTLNNNQPYSNTAFYVFDNEFNLYIWTDISTLHCKNIKKNNKVAINIFDSTQKLGSYLQGIQCLGKARITKGNEMIKAGLMYIKRYPKVLTLIKNYKEFSTKDSKIYKIILDKIKLFDEKTFGKDQHIEIMLERKKIK